MTPAAIYMIMLLHGKVQVEITSRPLTATQCYEIGEGWTRRTPGNTYKCIQLKPDQQTKK